MNRDRLLRLLPISLIALASGLLSIWGLTRSGFANTYYAEAAQAASRSWSAWLTNATDASLSVSLDKGPLPNMMLGLFGRLLGFSSFSLLLPEALCGVGSVLLLYDTVRRTLGRRAGLLAATMLAMTPIFVAMSRFDNPDALLVLLEVAAAWALVRALQSGRTAHVLLCGVFMGLAFNVKMLQAYLIVPALAAALLLAGQGGVRRRLAQLAGGGAAMLAVSFAWYGAMMLVTAGSRPWVGDTTDNSWFSLIFGANGFGRVSGEGVGFGGGAGGGGPAGASGFGGSAGLPRLFNPIVGGQIAWLLPLAALGLALGLWAAHRSPRTDLRRAAYVLWGGWALISWLVFSLAAGVFHPYYTTALAPAVAALAAGGLVLMWDRARGSAAWALALGAAMIGTAALAWDLLGRTSDYAPFVGPLTLVLAVFAAGALLFGRAAPAVALAGLIAVLAGPAAYSIATTGRTLFGGNPLAGPIAVERLSGPAHGRRGVFALAALRSAAGLPGVPPPRAQPLIGAFGAGPIVPVGPGSRGAPLAGVGSAQVSGALLRYLKSHQGSAKYIVAAQGSNTAGAIALQSGREAIDMGGFMGADPAPSLSKLRSLIDSGQLHYVLLSLRARGGSFASAGAAAGGPPASAGAASGGTSAGAPFGAPLGARGGASASAALAATSARDAWVRAHGTAVHVVGLGAGELMLYYFA
ncbi:MAG TPA: glycosyltransferase family 39 protein [Solirubrobacteraceae bacterium]|jgi:4-amino-4-deoxy-L-arabinose transferase-like glycosyltransferase|nr:glycosyltransferase family 39 protein [Solirubrobacteraceae bacterium]